MKLAGHRVRADAEARRFWTDLRGAIGHRVPEGKAVIVTLQAPIRQANKTVAALAERIVRHLQHGGAGARWEILGNRIRILIAAGDFQSKVMGFVFTDEVNPEDLLAELIPRRAARPRRPG